MTNVLKVFRKPGLILLLCPLVFLAVSCKISMVADYDDQIAKQIESTAKRVDKFYLTMLETTTQDDEGREYDRFVNEYIDIEVELNALLNRNKVKSLNKNSTRINEIILELWIKYKQEHKADVSLSDVKIKLNRKNMGDLFFAMLAAEEGKKLIDDTDK